MVTWDCPLSRYWKRLPACGPSARVKKLAGSLKQARALSRLARVSWSRARGHTEKDMRPPWLAVSVLVRLTTPPSPYVACTP